jgi:hypothetical protein
MSPQFVQQLHIVGPSFPFLLTEMERMLRELTNLIPDRQGCSGLTFMGIMKELGSDSSASYHEYIDLIFWLILATLAMNAFPF